MDFVNVLKAHDTYITLSLIKKSLLFLNHSIGVLSSWTWKALQGKGLFYISLYSPIVRTQCWHIMGAQKYLFGEWILLTPKFRACTISVICAASQTYPKRSGLKQHSTLILMGGSWGWFAWAHLHGGHRGWLSEWGASVPHLVSHQPVGLPDFHAAWGSQRSQGENRKLHGLLSPRLESHIRSCLLHPMDKTLSQS